QSIGILLLVGHGLFTSTSDHRMIEVTVQAALVPNALMTGINVDLALLLGMTITSLARIGTSWFRPRMTALTSTGISRFVPPASSRKITAFPGAATGLAP